MNSAIKLAQEWVDCYYSNARVVLVIKSYYNLGSYVYYNNGTMSQWSGFVSVQLNNLLEGKPTAKFAIFKKPIQSDR